jgi:hypothetical protein
MPTANDTYEETGADARTRIALNAMLAGGAGLLGLITWLIEKW